MALECAEVKEAHESGVLFHTIEHPEGDSFEDEPIILGTPVSLDMQLYPRLFLDLSIDD